MEVGIESYPILSLPVGRNTGGQSVSPPKCGRVGLALAPPALTVVRVGRVGVDPSPFPERVGGRPPQLGKR